MFSRMAADRVNRRAPTLSARQRQVLARLLTSETNKEIAAALQISDQCVKYHLTQLFRKFRVDNRVALALLAERINEGEAESQEQHLPAVASESVSLAPPRERGGAGPTLGTGATNEL
jgi:DNA-binding CsgD family transcriptional regulator